LQSQPPGPHIPLGCTFLFSPGWETDSRGGTAARGRIAALDQPARADRSQQHHCCTPERR
jgi:hypothetical protein